MSELSEDVELQIKQQGLASYKVSDGEVFVFTKETLQQLLDAAQESGRCILFVKSRISV